MFGSSAFRGGAKPIKVVVALICQWLCCLRGGLRILRMDKAKSVLERKYAVIKQRVKLPMLLYLGQKSRVKLSKQKIVFQLYFQLLLKFISIPCSKSINQMCKPIGTTQCIIKDFHSNRSTHMSIPIQEQLFEFLILKHGRRKKKTHIYPLQHHT